ncbi:Nif3-like dinuclear metal center hexameric protein [Planctomicrobium sp.]|jgi:dinuclear metal center YbgI/SA1388 family protein|nr:Nif3-like dinuclear metal center hexameric protein [Planctomicrobium sp.]MDB4439411.1 Nif3-like dinuclear metal center hexameric protein [Planctomicrobium sp.]MDB4743040.1 Nif3-like dinuclear metal center hexameric protein [Planctomicrobium sp.]
MALELKQIIEFLEDFAPLELAEEWDNVGLLVGDESAEIERVITCLTITPDVVQEAIQTKANLIVAHHPMMFRAVNKLTSRSIDGKMLLDLIQNRIAVYSPHTAFDSAAKGINQKLAEDLGLTKLAPIRSIEHERLPAESGSGRYGELPKPISLEELLEKTKQVMSVPHLQYVGEMGSTITKVAVACGAAAQYLSDARQLGCEVLITGEARFHGCLEARSTGMSLIVAGHYATERPAVEELANVLNQSFSEIEVFPSQVENDPLQWSVS